MPKFYKEKNLKLSMSKKVIPKKKISTKKVSSVKTKPKTSSKNASVEKVLIENFISLQKVMTNLAMKFDGLSTQISKLLELFEISAKTLAEKDIKLDKGKEDKKVVERLDTLLNQNKIIARSLTLLHEGPDRMPNLPPQQMMRQPAPSQRSPRSLQPSPVRPAGNGEYQKSMLVKNQAPPKPTRLVKKNEKIF